MSPLLWSSLLFAALMMVLTHQPNLHMERIDPIVTSSQVLADGTRVETRILGQTWCELTETEGYPDTWRVLRITYSSLDTLEHEMLHAADCVDNGRMDGSLLPYPPTHRDAAHEFVYWCQSNVDECISIHERSTPRYYTTYGRSSITD